MSRYTPLTATEALQLTQASPHYQQRKDEKEAHEMMETIYSGIREQCTNGYSSLSYRFIVTPSNGVFNQVLAILKSQRYLASCDSGVLLVSWLNGDK